MKQTIACLGVSAATLMVDATASADEPLFEKGRVVLDVLGADIPVSGGALTGNAGPIVVSSFHSAMGADSTRYTTTQSTYGLEPSADYFIGDHLTIGGKVGVDWESNHDFDAAGYNGGTTHSYTQGLRVNVGPRIGYAIPIFSSLGFWPRIGGGVVEEHLTANGGVDYDRHGGYVTGNFSLIARLAPHVLLELGPQLTYFGETGGLSNSIFGPTGGPSQQSDTTLDLTARTSFRVDF